MKATRADAYQLLHNASLCFSRMEEHGIRIDVEYLDRAIKETQEKIRNIEKEMREDEVYKTWRKLFAQKTNFQSKPQLNAVLRELRLIPRDKKVKMDIENLQGIDVPFTRLYLQKTKLDKLEGTYLKGIRREVIDERIHCFFNLHTVWTFRSSSSEINFQNQPNRDEEQAETCRRSFIPDSDEFVLVESDFKGIEVFTSAFYHKDKRFIKDITVGDMHKDTAALCFLLSKDEVTKDVRSHVKNKFVFPEFYGDWYQSCCQMLWQAVERFHLKTTSGVPLFDHLRSQGITRLGACNPESKPVPGTFEYRVKEVEDKFWNVWYTEYTQWKKDFYAAYVERGYFDLLTGFRCEGIFDRKQVCNTPIQGVAFHCLLWVLIKLDKWLRKYKMKSRICGQIHDSILSNVHRKEYDDYVGMVKYLVSEGLRKHWDFIILPMECEIEVCEDNWFNKKKVA